MIRIGATALPASVLVPPLLTLDTDANRTAPSAAEVEPAACDRPTDDTVTSIRGVPEITVNAVNGLDANRATWPGIPPPRLASAVPARAEMPDSPGSEEMPAGDPPGGFRIVCSGPASSTVAIGVAAAPASPG